MNEEEKKAIDKLQYTIEINQNILDGIEIDEQVIKSMETTLNLIDKQQKEIENYQILKDDIEGHNIVYVDTPEFEEKYISKDEIRHIRDKAECMDYYSLNDVIDDLTKLIGDDENNE